MIEAVYNTTNLFSENHKAESGELNQESSWWLLGFYHYPCSVILVRRVGGAIAGNVAPWGLGVGVLVARLRRPAMEGNGVTQSHIAKDLTKRLKIVNLCGGQYGSGLS